MAEVRHELISDFIDYLWGNKDIKENLKFGKITATEAYNNCLALFKQPYQNIFKE